MISSTWAMKRLYFLHPLSGSLTIGMTIPAEDQSKDHQQHSQRQVSTTRGRFVLRKSLFCCEILSGLSKWGWRNLLKRPHCMRPKHVFAFFQNIRGIEWAQMVIFPTCQHFLFGRPGHVTSTQYKVQWAQDNLKGQISEIFTDLELQARCKF